MPAPVRQTRTALPSVHPQSGAVVEDGVGPAVVDDQRQVLPRETAILRPGSAPPCQDDDVDAAVLVGDDRPLAGLERLVQLPVDEEAALAVAVDEAAVEGREQPPALACGTSIGPRGEAFGGS